jgi:hypothetical protein
MEHEHNRPLLGMVIRWGNMNDIASVYSFHGNLEDVGALGYVFEC